MFEMSHEGVRFLQSLADSASDLRNLLVHVELRNPFPGSPAGLAEVCLSMGFLPNVPRIVEDTPECTAPNSA